VATAGFVDAMGMTVIAGRDISPQDVASSEQIVLINQTAAKTSWPGQNALRKLLKFGGADRRVAGIVGDVRHLTLEEGAGIDVYLPMRQVFDFSSLNLIVRTNHEPAPLAKSLRTVLAPVDPNLATNEVQTLQGAVDKASRRAGSSRRCSAGSRCSRCAWRCSGSMASSRTP
jgi:hypothetical protein